ncbi:MAG TPA: hypothetical protein VMV92_40475 [Streptosporangiaceae bacterium]|nr:hypothetical protein [Streptosporangiaceae bacterium]
MCPAIALAARRPREPLVDEELTAQLPVAAVYSPRPLKVIMMVLPSCRARSGARPRPLW